MKPPTDDEDSIALDSLSPCIAALKKSLSASAAKMPFVQEAFERPQQDLARLENAWRLIKAGHRGSHHRSRSFLNLLTNGLVERWIASSTNAELKSHFKKVWREDAKPPRNAGAKLEGKPAAVPPVATKTISAISDKKENQLS